MSLTVGTNSWVSVAEADTYFSDHWTASSTWSGLTNTQKEQLLITAYRWIQAQSAFSISPAATAALVKTAQMELAWYVYNYMTETEDRRALYAQGVREFELSKWSETLEKGGFPPFIADYLDDYTTRVGGRFPTATRELNT
jgi:hypothetical protein